MLTPFAFRSKEEMKDKARKGQKRGMKTRILAGQKPKEKKNGNSKQKFSV